MTETLTFRLENIVHARQAVLEDFEGPLDLIIDLLRRNKIELQDLKITLLLEQYLAWLEARRAMDLEVASEFIAMASHLVYLKTKMLLTVGDAPDEEVDELILALEERMRQEKLAAVQPLKAFLESRAEYGRSILTKPPESIERDKTYRRVHPVSALTDALRGVYERTERRTPPPPSVFSAIVGREPYPVGEKVTQIVQGLIRRGKTLLGSVLRLAQSRSEVIASFLAVLELCRNRHILIDDAGGDYYLELAPDFESQAQLISEEE